MADQDWRDQLYRDPFMPHINAKEDALRGTVTGRLSQHVPIGIRGEWQDAFPVAEKGQWVNIYGKLMPLKHMDTSHLVNVAAILWRTGVQIKYGLMVEDKPTGWRKAKLLEVLAELKKREV